MIKSTELDALNIINDLDDLYPLKKLGLEVLTDNYQPYFHLGQQLSLDLLQTPKQGDVVVVVYEDVDYCKSPQGRFVRRTFVNRMIGVYCCNNENNQYKIQNININHPSLQFIEENTMLRHRIAGVIASL